MMSKLKAMENVDIIILLLQTISRFERTFPPPYAPLLGLHLWTAYNPIFALSVLSQNCECIILFFIRILHNYNEIVYEIS